MDATGQCDGMGCVIAWIAIWPELVHSIPLIAGTVAGILIFWFAYLEGIVFLTFDGGMIEILEPVREQISLQDTRLLILGKSERPRQNLISSLFTGFVAQRLSDSTCAATIHPVKIAKKVWHTVKVEGGTRIEPTDELLYDQREYRLTSESGQTIRFKYRNEKHRRETA